MEVPQINNEIFSSMLSSWYDSLQDPSNTQQEVLHKLLSIYQKTRYGRKHSSSEVTNIEDFRANFPKTTYKSLSSLLTLVKRGDYKVLLSEPPELWVMTRGSTGTAKILPATKTHLEQIYRCGARAFVNHLNRSRDYELVKGKILNLSFPSRVSALGINDDSQIYGYSSGTYSRIFPTFGEASLIPRQEKIDSAGSGITKADWEQRFELVYQEALNEDIKAVIGVAPVILSFARFLKRVYGKLPKELWGIKAIFPTSVRKIQYKYAPKFRKYFGEISLIEIYSATEGVFAQQLDELPYVSPNYDTYLFEVETSDGLKMLHELERGEWGRLIISSCMFPRYDIGDMIESLGKNYFRVFGRAKRLHILEHKLYRLLYGWFL